MDQVFLTINAWMTQGLLLGALGCFLWGMVSVLFSPCHLASIPLIVSYVAGQNQIVAGKKAVLYAVAFTIGLFITIATIGVVCTLLGRMLGDVGPYMSIAVGAILVWVSLDILGVAKCSMSSGLMAKIKVKGLFGALVLGLAYGILSGSCTFGFIAPILAIITVQQKILTGVVFILLFGIGHCIPIAVAGSSTAMVKRFLENSAWQQGSGLFRKLAGVCIGALGIYFISQPLMAIV
ncbi:cytochrome c biogenesis protein transmembrane region [Desulfobulbus propionicus DSM 2032]|uniref:Cytochrome c biogenesis protein transmembrane region n=1 Tax=Desulfobulbus propionicus (strain ATCC 33891 / DSM 2032 / VKM B-1956 / 1pr3) TaxID=577650 RepID=A0A7U3YL83_DESPD|nr:cytochrome c biogenesis protein CcdA [Desulfobulbus propionicus]ADW17420.1 cytochrome c biogenesis protein transmembrane region [Desulfobulbus propionicus DSM 2032]